MAFIGIITAKKDEVGLKKALIQHLKKINLRENIIVINENNIENMKNIKFDTIIIHQENLGILNRQELLTRFIEQSKFLILNSDVKLNLELISNLKVTVITYGLNLKATVTASSIENDKICICIQRAIQNVNGDVIEPKEISVESQGSDVYRSIISYILEILYG